MRCLLKSRNRRDLKLAIGTAQFGSDYGIANKTGKISYADGKKIIDSAYAAGIDTIDTAIAYGESERQLGLFGVSGWRVVSKLPKLPESVHSIPLWVRNQTAESIERLGVPNLHGLLVHRVDDLLGSLGNFLFEALLQVQQAGFVEKVGVSVYVPEDIDAILSRFPIDIIQVPFNIFDRRLLDRGWLCALQKEGIEVHTRSVFLQGLLLMQPESRPNYFRRWQKLWDRWDGWLADTGISPVTACLRYALSEPAIDRVIVGIDSFAQFEEILGSASVDVAVPPAELRSDDPDLINPSRWQLS